MGPWDRINSDPKLRAMLDDLVEQVASGKPANLDQLTDLLTEIDSYEHQRQRAIFAGEIKPDEPYLAALTPGQQRGQVSLFLWRYINHTLMERRKAERIQAAADAPAPTAMSDMPSDQSA